MRLVAFTFAILLSTSCAADEVHHIDGAKSNFCLPDANKVADVPWIPVDKPGTPDSFAFAGCAGMKNYKGTCGTPASVVGGYVEERSAFHSQRWGDVVTGSTLKKINSDPSAEVKVAENGMLVIVHNVRLWAPDWFVWLKATRVADQVRPHLDDDDVLLASCHYRSMPVLHAPTKDVFDCDRSIQAGDYSLHYTYQSETIVPSNLKSLDSELMASIDRWRCNESH